MADELMSDHQPAEEPMEEQPTDALDLEVALAEQARLAEENYERFLRARAELDNTRRRLREEMERTRRFANEQLVAELLPVADNLGRALQAATDADASSLRQGVEMIHRQMWALLEREGVRPIRGEPGETFDPAVHEAIDSVPTGNMPEGSIVETIQPGYWLHDRVLRPCQVRVAVTPTAS